LGEGRNQIRKKKQFSEGSPEVRKLVATPFGAINKRREKRGEVGVGELGEGGKIFLHADRGGIGAKKSGRLGKKLKGVYCNANYC